MSRIKSFLLNKSEYKKVILKIPFREISEAVVGIDNKKLTIKIIRLFIRYQTRIAGYSFSTRVLSLILLATKSRMDVISSRYIRYILEVNKLRIQYLNLLSKNNMNEAVLKKNQWAEFACSNSMNRVSRCSAKGYLSLLSRHGYHDMKSYKSRVALESVSKNKFYIYGPNASSKPSKKYEEYVLVMMKPIDLNINFYKENILFVNSVYYNDVICKNETLKNDLIKSYRKIYVSCREAVLREPFIRSKFPMGDQLASPMGLGRVLYNLTKTYGKFSCVIEGFDFFLDKALYGAYYPTLTRDKNNMISEQVTCSSLADHDALYNFLFVKELVSELDIVESVDFNRIINLSGKDYLDELSKVRNFECLR